MVSTVESSSFYPIWIAYDGIELPIDLGIHGIRGFPTFLLFIPIVDILPKRVQLLPDFVRLLCEILPRH